MMTGSAACRRSRCGSGSNSLIRLDYLSRNSVWQVMKPVGVAVGQEEVETARQAYQQSCLRLADHFLRTKVGNT